MADVVEQFRALQLEDRKNLYVVYEMHTAPE